jgi:phospholipid-transporting ATPase
MCKDAFADWRKHKQDKLYNSLMYTVWNGSNFLTRMSKDLRVGNIVLLKSGDTVPADMLFLASGH